MLSWGGSGGVLGLGVGVVCCVWGGDGGVLGLGW